MSGEGGGGGSTSLCFWKFYKSIGGFFTRNNIKLAIVMNWGLEPSHYLRHTLVVKTETISHQKSYIEFDFSNSSRRFLYQYDLNFCLRSLTR